MIAILNILLRDEKLGEDVDIDRLSKETDGFSGSDLKRKSQPPRELTVQTCVFPPHSLQSKTWFTYPGRKRLLPSQL